MRIDSKKTAELLRDNDNILILTHKNPDGDTIGGGVALCRVLAAAGKRVRVENSDSTQRYAFLLEGLESPDFEEEFIIAVDVADTSLLGEKLSRYADSIDLCIDHHSSNREYAKHLYLCPEDGAVCLSLYRLFREMGADISEETADALYTGISTDTGCFRYSNASAECHRAAAELIELGARAEFINRLMFETKPPSYFRLLTEVFAGMRLYLGGKCCVLCVTQEMLKRTGASSEHCDAIAAMSRRIEGAAVGITMKETEDKSYKFSLRSYAPVDSAKLCAAFGGGGHSRAAGCTPNIDRDEALQLMLDGIADALAVEHEKL